MLTYHKRGSVAFSWEQFHRKCSRYQFVKRVWNYTFEIISTFPRGQWVNPLYSLRGRGKPTTIWCWNQVNTMAVDALAPYVTRPSATMVSNMHNKRLLVFHCEGFLLHAPSVLWKMLTGRSVNTIPSNALAPSVARSPTAIKWQCTTNWSSSFIRQDFNPLHAKFFRGNKNILPQVREGPTYSI